jgi:RNA polymerase sigma-70 factor (ECF subfamily)
MRSFAFAADAGDADDVSVDARVTRAFEAWRQRGYHYAVAIGATPETAEEAVQESFLRLFGELSRGRRVDNVPGWLFRVIRNLVADQSRSRSRETRLGEFDFDEMCQRLADPRPTAEQTVLEQERLKRFHEDLKSLTAHQREVLFLRAEGFRHREVGEIMGLAPSTVSDLLRRAIRRLTRESL